jgi:hypothetical protein
MKILIGILIAVPSVVIIGMIAQAVRLICKLGSKWRPWG